MFLDEFQQCEEQRNQWISHVMFWYRNEQEELEQAMDKLIKMTIRQRKLRDLTQKDKK